MARASPAVAAFNAGEFAPQMEGRVDIEKYAIASHIQQNFIPLKQGPAMFRPGSVFVQPVKNSQFRTWLYPFQFSQSQGNSFLLEFGDHYVRFYSNHGPLLATGISAWVSTTNYVLGNLVLYSGAIYYAIAASQAATPSSSPTSWYPMTPYQGSGTTAIYEIPSPYAVADLTDQYGQFTLQIAQQGDVLYIAGGAAGAGYAPQTLTRYANAPPNWQFATYAPTDGPFANAIPLVPGSEIAMVVSAAQGTGITISAFGGSVFAPTDVGRLVRIGSGFFNVTPWEGQQSWTAGQTCVNNGNNYVALNSATSGINAPVQTAGAQLDGPGGVLWLYTDSGYGIAQITGYTSQGVVTANVLKRFPANVVWNTTFPSITGATNANPCVLTVANSLVAGQAVFLVGVGGMTQINQIPLVVSAANGTTATLGGVDATTYGAYTSGGTLVPNGSVEWQLGSWSNTTEWPRAVAFFKDRLFWGGKLNVWGSVPGLYNSQTPDFFGQQTTDSAMNELVSGADASNITWLSPAIILLIGTEGGEYGLDSANYSTSPLGPANVEILRQSQWRCRALHPFLVGVTLVYVQRAGRKVLAADYNFYLNRYDSTDQSKYAYHLSIGGLTGVAYQQEPFSLLWCTRADGTLLSYTFNREDNVTAWARHNLGGNGAVESVAAINAPDGSRDEVWLIVNRTINGQTARYVEYFAKHFEGPQGGYAGDAQSSAWYVDCGAQALNTPAPGATTTTVTGLQYLTGQTVSILADGGVQPQQIVPTSGTITIQGAFHTITVGLPYQGNLVPMRFEGGADVGTAQGKRKQGATLVLRLVDSFGGVVGQLSDQNATTQIYQNPLGLTSQTLINTEAIQYNLTTTELDMPPPIQSGDYPVSFPAQAASDSDDRDFYMLVQQNFPMPMTVVGLFPSYKVEEPQ